MTLDAVLAHATPQSSSLTPQLVGRYPARTPIKDKEWPGIIEKALRAVQDSKALQGYDVVPSMLTDQYDLIGWLQVLCCAALRCVESQTIRLNSETSSLQYEVKLRNAWRQ